MYNKELVKFTDMVNNHINEMYEWLVNKELLEEKCVKLRHEKNLSLEDVARITDNSVDKIQSFEQGRNKNALILIWYLKTGLEI